MKNKYVNFHRLMKGFYKVVLIYSHLVEIQEIILMLLVLEEAVLSLISGHHNDFPGLNHQLIIWASVSSLNS